jgi:hypothetical protein
MKMGAVTAKDPPENPNRRSNDPRYYLHLHHLQLDYIPVRKRPAFNINTSVAKKMRSHPAKNGIQNRSIERRLPIFSSNIPATGVETTAASFIRQ